MFFSQNHFLSLNFSLCVSKSSDVLVLNSRGYFLFVYLYNFWFFLDSFFLKLKFFCFSSYLCFLSRLRVFLRKQNIFYYCRLRLKGLGFRIRKFGSYSYRFFFTCVNFFYLHLPYDVSLKYRVD